MKDINLVGNFNITLNSLKDKYCHDFYLFYGKLFEDYIKNVKIIDGESTPEFGETLCSYGDLENNYLDLIKKYFNNLFEQYKSSIIKHIIGKDISFKNVDGEIIHGRVIDIFFYNTVIDTHELKYKIMLVDSFSKLYTPSKILKITNP